MPAAYVIVTQSLKVDVLKPFFTLSLGQSVERGGYEPMRIEALLGQWPSETSEMRK